VSGGTIFPATQGRGVWRRPLSEMITITTNLRQPLSQTSKDFSLIAYNKFNRTITISFSLAQPQPVNLKIYNLCGREIATLINKNFIAGKHCISWETRKLAVGCYAVKMQAGSNVFVKNVLVSR
jgi:hypothetical protein